MDKHVFVVTGAEGGIALSALLAQRLDQDRHQLRQRVAAGSVYVNGRRQLNADAPVVPGQKVTLYSPEPEPEPEDGEALVLGVAYQDREVVVVDKPSGLLSVPDRRGGRSTVDQLVDQQWGARARLLHRLDRDASGLLLVSRNPGKVRRSLTAQISSHRLRRRYLAVVAGAPKQREQVISGSLSVQRGVTRSSQDPRARPAESHVRLLTRQDDRSLLQVSLKTGRTHQIRAHLAEQGIPIFGDTRYGGPPAPRLALHAHCLGFRHPRGKGMVEIHSPLPPELRALF